MVESIAWLAARQTTARAIDGARGDDPERKPEPALPGRISRLRGWASRRLHALASAIEPRPHPAAPEPTMRA